jgi:nicotinate-nucleotide adenylyltransferase
LRGSDHTLSQRRIGAYGGTFDPIHNGHIEVVRAVAQNFRLEQLLIIPAHRPPHKTSRTISDAYHRYAMAVLASFDEPCVIVSTLEIDAPDKPYSFQTIERLRSSYGDEPSLFFIIGADSFEEINTWREPARLLASTNLVVVTRPGYEVQSSHLPDDFKSSIIDMRGRSGDEARLEDNAEAGAGARRIYLTDYVNKDISSTQIRQRARDGEPIDELVPARVAKYIEKYELYRR